MFKFFIFLQQTECSLGQYYNTEAGALTCGALRPKYFLASFWSKHKTLKEYR